MTARSAPICPALWSAGDSSASPSWNSRTNDRRQFHDEPMIRNHFPTAVADFCGECCIDFPRKTYDPSGRRLAPCSTRATDDGSDPIGRSPRLLRHRSRTHPEKGGLDASRRRTNASSQSQDRVYLRERRSTGVRTVDHPPTPSSCPSPPGFSTKANRRNGFHQIRRDS